MTAYEELESPLIIEDAISDFMRNVEASYRKFDSLRDKESSYEFKLDEPKFNNSKPQVYNDVLIYLTKLFNEKLLFPLITEDEILLHSPSEPSLLSFVWDCCSHVDGHHFEWGYLLGLIVQKHLTSGYPKYLFT